MDAPRLVAAMTAPVLAAHAWPSNADLIAACHQLGYLLDTDHILDPTSYFARQRAKVCGHAYYLPLPSRRLHPSEGAGQRQSVLRPVRSDRTSQGEEGRQRSVAHRKPRHRLTGEHPSSAALASVEDDPGAVRRDARCPGRPLRQQGLRPHRPGLARVPRRSRSSLLPCEVFVREMHPRLALRIVQSSSGVRP